MQPAPFGYRVAHSVEEALELLHTHQDAKILAGGHSLIPALKLRLTQPKLLVDISRIPALRGIHRENGTLRIGALVTHREIETSSVVHTASPVIGAVAGHIGDQQVRHRGTFAGSLAHADPAADWPAGALAADATMIVAGHGGTRTIAATDFFTGMLTTAMHPDEILTEIHVPANGHAGVYVKQRNQASGYAIVGVAATATHDHGHITHVAIGVTGVAEKAYRATATEGVLHGASVSGELLDRAASHAADGIDCLSDIHAPSEYRRHLVTVLVRRALHQLLHA